MKKQILILFFLFIPSAQAGKNIPYNVKPNIYIKGKWNFESTTKKECRINNGKMGKCYITFKIPGNHPYPNGKDYFSMTGFINFSDNYQGTLSYDFNVRYTFANPNSRPINTKRKMVFKFKLIKKGKLNYIKVKSGNDEDKMLLTLKKNRIVLKMVQKNKCTFNGLVQPCFEVLNQVYKR